MQEIKGMVSWALMLLLPLTGGCATTQTDGHPVGVLGTYNHAMFSFNMTVDKAVLRPVAKGYVSVTPQPLRQRVTDFFSNLDDVPVTFNALLQLKFGQAARELTRLVFNSTFGLFGLFDVASGWGLPQHKNDFGMTLARWGVPEGPYIILPLLGPSTLRNTLSPVIDGVYLDPIYYYPHPVAQWSAAGLRIIDERVQLLPLDSQLDEAYNPYTLMRSAYLQHRRYLLEQNNPGPAKKKHGLTPLQKQLLQMQGGN